MEFSPSGNMSVSISSARRFTPWSYGTKQIQTTLRHDVAIKVGMYLGISVNDSPQRMMHVLWRIFFPESSSRQDSCEVSQSNQELTVRCLRIFIHVIVVMPGVDKTTWDVRPGSHHETGKVCHSLILQNINGRKNDHANKGYHQSKYNVVRSLSSSSPVLQLSLPRSKTTPIQGKRAARTEQQLQPPLSSPLRSGTAISILQSWTQFGRHRR